MAFSDMDAAEIRLVFKDRGLSGKRKAPVIEGAFLLYRENRKELFYRITVFPRQTLSIRLRRGLS